MARSSSIVKKHRIEGPKSVTVAIITVSDTRTYQTDKSGRLIEEALVSRGHKVACRGLCLDEPPEIMRALAATLTIGCDAVIFNGGTGISPRDVTIDTIAPRLERRIDGFGELFRLLGYREIGGAAMLSRAMAGTIGGIVVFCLPGSPSAVSLAMEKLILPELSHIIGLIKGHRRHA